MADRKRMTFLLLAPLAVLMIPLLANQMVEGFNWDVIDFVIAAILLYGTSAAIEISYRIVTNRSTRLIVVIVILVLFALVFAEMAVGLFGSPLAGS